MVGSSKVLLQVRDKQQDLGDGRGKSGEEIYIENGNFMAMNDGLEWLIVVHKLFIVVNSGNKLLIVANDDGYPLVNFHSKLLENRNFTAGQINDFYGPWLQQKTVSFPEGKQVK